MNHSNLNNKSFNTYNKVLLSKSLNTNKGADMKQSTVNFDTTCDIMDETRANWSSDISDCRNSNFDGNFDTFADDSGSAGYDQYQDSKKGTHCGEEVATVSVEDKEIVDTDAKAEAVRINHPDIVAMRKRWLSYIHLEVLGGVDPLEMYKQKLMDYENRTVKYWLSRLSACNDLTWLSNIGKKIAGISFKYTNICILRVAFLKAKDRISSFQRILSEEEAINVNGSF
jgi:hypothetical protein